MEEFNFVDIEDEFLYMKDYKIELFGIELSALALLVQYDETLYDKLMSEFVEERIAQGDWIRIADNEFIYASNATHEALDYTSATEGDR